MAAGGTRAEPMLATYKRLLDHIGTVERGLGIAPDPVHGHRHHGAGVHALRARPTDRLGRGIGHLRLHLDGLRRCQRRPEAGPPHPYRHLRRASAGARGRRHARAGLGAGAGDLGVLVVQGWKVMGVEGRSSTISLPIELPRSWFYSLPLTRSAASMILTALYLLLQDLQVSRPAPLPGLAARPQAPRRCRWSLLLVRPVRAADRARNAGGLCHGSVLHRHHHLHAADPAVDRRAAHGHGAGQLRADRDPAVRAGRPPAQPRGHCRPHLRVRRRAGGPHPRRAGACQRGGEHDLRRHERRCPGRRRGPGRGRGQRHAQGRLRPGLRRGRQRRVVDHRPDHPAVGDHGRVCGDGTGVGGRHVPGRLPAGHPDGRRLDGDDLLDGQHRARGRAADAADVLSTPGPHFRARATGTRGAGAS